MGNVKWSLTAFAAVAALSVAAAGGMEEKYTADDFRVRDPFVLAEDGVYYLYESKAFSGGTGAFVRVSRDLKHWSGKKEVMTVPPGMHTTAVWAPEVHKYNGAYWMFATVTRKIPVPGKDGKIDKKRGTWVFRSESPLEPFVAVKKGPVPPEDWFTLDGTLLVDGGKPYMVFCHEWVQIKDGKICYAPLSDDFASFTAPPVDMLSAYGAVEGAQYVTDGPYFWRSEKSDTLYMVWSNFIKRADSPHKDYIVLVRKSESGTLAGPWSKDEILFEKDGGHSMIFKDFDGRILLSLHQTNNNPHMKLFELEDTGKELRFKAKGKQ